MSNGQVPVDQLQVQPPAGTEPAPEEPKLNIQPDMTDHILTPQQTEDMLRGMPGPTEAPEGFLPDDDDPEQAQMAADFFDTLPGEQVAKAQDLPPQPGQPDQSQPAPWDQPTPPPTPEQVQQYQNTAEQPQPQGPPATQPGTTDPALVALQSQMAVMQQTNEALRQQLAQMQAPQAAQPGQPGGAPPIPTVPTFNLSVPDQYVEALGADDGATRKAALDSLVNGIAETIYARTQQDMQTQQALLPNAVQTQIEAQRRAQEIHQDMYGTYPELANFKDHVVAASQSFGISPDQWTEDVRDAIAERVAPLVPGLYQKVNANRAQRYGAYQAQQVPAASMPAQPGGQYTVPNPVPGGHGQPVHSPAPVLVRDANGNVTAVTQPPGYAPQVPQARPPSSQAVSGQVEDIWNTLGF